MARCKNCGKPMSGGGSAKPKGVKVAPQGNMGGGKPAAKKK